MDCTIQAIHYVLKDMEILYKKDSPCQRTRPEDIALARKYWRNNQGKLGSTVITREGNQQAQLDIIQTEEIATLITL